MNLKKIKDSAPVDRWAEFVAALDEHPVLSHCCDADVDDEEHTVLVSFSGVGWWLADMDEKDVPEAFKEDWTKVQSEGFNEDRWNPGTDKVEDILAEFAETFGFEMGDEVDCCPEHDRFEFVEKSKDSDSAGGEVSLNIRSLFNLGEDVAWKVIQMKPFSSYTEDQLRLIYECLNPELSYEEWVEVNS